LLTLNGNSDSSTVSSEDISFVIEDLIACVGYEVSIRAANGKDNSANAATFITTTETNVNSPIKIIVYIYDEGMEKLKLMLMSCILDGCLSC